MTVATWPATLPQAPDGGGFEGGPQNNRLSFKPEIGPTIDRRRGSSKTHIYSFKFSLLTPAQRAAFETFYSETLLDGTGTFYFDDPISGTTHTWKFTDDNPPYNLSGDRYIYSTLTFKAQRIA